MAYPNMVSILTDKRERIADEILSFIAIHKTGEGYDFLNTYKKTLDSYMRMIEAVNNELDIWREDD